MKRYRKVELLTSYYLPKVWLITPLKYTVVLLHFCNWKTVPNLFLVEIFVERDCNCKLRGTNFPIHKQKTKIAYKI